MNWEKRAEHAEAALRVIASYDSLAYLRRQSTGQYGLEYTEALEMAYENIIGDAKSALHRLPRKSRKVALKPVVGSEPHDFVGGFDIDPTNPSRCQICGKEHDGRNGNADAVAGNSDGVVFNPGTSPEEQTMSGDGTGRR